MTGVPLKRGGFQRTPLPARQFDFIPKEGAIVQAVGKMHRSLKEMHDTLLSSGGKEDHPLAIPHGMPPSPSEVSTATTARFAGGDELTDELDAVFEQQGTSVILRGLDGRFIKQAEFDRLRRRDDVKVVVTDTPNDKTSLRLLEIPRGLAENDAETAL